MHFAKRSKIGWLRGAPVEGSHASWNRGTTFFGGGGSFVRERTNLIPITTRIARTITAASGFMGWLSHSAGRLASTYIAGLIACLRSGIGDTEARARNGAGST